MLGTTGISTLETDDIRSDDIRPDQATQSHELDDIRPDHIRPDRIGPEQATQSREPAAVDYATGFADLARLLREATTPQETMDLICRAAVSVLACADYASITVCAGERYTTVAASDPAARALDQAQYIVAQGPCLDAIVADDIVVCDDLRTDPRWPSLPGSMTAAGDARSVLSLRLRQHDTAASLNVYSARPGAFSGQTQAVGAVFAVHAAVAVQAATDRLKAVNLQTALENSRQIGAAIGILMSRENITEDAAFDRLRNVSQNANCKLRDVAADVLLTGQLPPAATEQNRSKRAASARSATLPHSSIRRGSSWLAQ